MKRTAQLLLVLLLAASAYSQTDSKHLVGLWAGRRDFGPDVRGVVLIQRDGDGWRAQIAGREARATIDKGTLSFALAGDEGSFRGLIRGDRVDGTWLQAGGYSTGFRFATPATLTKQPDGRWRGVVEPVDDHMRIFLPITANADGTLDTYLENPERNAGIYDRVEHIAIDGKRVTLLDKNKKAVIEGTYDAESDTISIPWRGSTYDLHRATVADEAAFYPRGKTPEPYVYRKPTQRDDGWPIGSIDEGGIDRAALTAFINSLTATPMDSIHAVQIHALLIARHGKLVVEEYFHDTSPDEPHDLRSAAKSFTTIMTGAAIRKGYPVSASTPVYETMYGKEEAAKVDPRKRAITMEHLLTMTSGLDCDDNDDKSPGNEDTMEEQTAQLDWYRYTLDLKMLRDPGKEAVYCSCQPNLAGGVLARTTGQWLPDLFRDTIAGPMQFRRWGLPIAPTGDVFTGGGMRLRPRDFTKLAQMMMNGGRWKETRVITPEWVKQSTRSLYVLRDFHSEYGYLFWIADYPWKGRTVRAYFAAGNGGQISMSIPDLDLVIAFAGGQYSDRHPFTKEYVPKLLLMMVR